MLVVTTMLTSIANDLPRTAGIKYIDIWMLFCLLIPVMEIILHTIEDHFIRKYYHRAYVHFRVVLSRDLGQLGFEFVTLQILSRIVMQIYQSYGENI